MTDEEKLELTPDQVKAFKSFERAYKKCKKVGIEFYTVLETVTALNGEYLESIHDDRNSTDYNLQDIPVGCPSIFDQGFSGWTDDTHYAKLR